MSIKVNTQTPFSSLVNFCQKRLDPEQAKEEMCKHPKNCLKNRNVDRAVQKGNYTFVLGALWRDKQHRLQFFKKYSSQLHAPLMFEEAIAHFRSKPTFATIHYISIPLIKAAVFRIQQDLQCTQNPSSVMDGKQLLVIYGKALDKATRKYLSCSLSSILRRNQTQRVRAIQKKVIEVVWQSSQNPLPPVYWVAHKDFALRQNINDQNIRKRFAYKFLAQSFPAPYLLQLTALIFTWVMLYHSRNKSVT